MRRIFFDEKHQIELMQKGYTTMPLLSEAEVSYILQKLENFTPDDNFTKNDNGQMGITLHCTIFDTNIDYKKKAYNLIREVFAKHIKQILVDYEIHFCNLFVKQPGKGKVDVHHHPPLLADLHDTALTFWCPLVDVDESNGALEVIEGSHKIIPTIATSCAPACFSHFEDKLFEKYMTPIRLKAGDCLIFDDSLIHGSKENHSSSPRSAIQISCIPSETNPVYFYLNRDAPDKYLDIFEVDSQFFVEHSIADLIVAPSGLKKVGVVENKNRSITEEELVRLLKNGDDIRHKIYSPEELTR